MKAQQVARGIGWTTLATAVNVTAQLVVSAVLARLLDPAAFGLVLMANVALRFVSFFAQMGSTQSLIQRPDMNASVTTAALVVALGVSSALYGVLLLAAPVGALFFAQPDLPHLLLWFGLTLPLGALGALPMALLRRNGQFRLSSGIDVCAYVLGYGVTGVACALSGLGVWSLVVATLVQQSLSAVLAFAASRYPLQWPLHFPTVKSVAGNGAGYSVVGFLEFIWANIESMSVGRLLGAAPLGVMNRAQMLANLPVEQAVGALNKVIFPALSTMQRDSARMGDGFLVLLATSGAISVLVACSVAAAAPDVVALLLGPQYADAVPVLRLLALAVPAMFMYSVCGITLDSLAAIGPKFRLQAALIVAKAGLMWALWSGELQAVALAALLAEYLRMAFGMRLVCRLLNLDGAYLIRMIALIVSMGLLTFAVVGTAAHAAQAASWPLAGRMALDALAGLLVLLLAVVLAARYGAGFPPLARFDSLRRLHARLRQFVFPLTPT